MKIINITGQRFGRLTVIKKAKRPVRIKNTAAYWLCRCECGTEKNINGVSLRNGDTQSCGCLKKEILLKRLKLNKGEAAFNRIFAQYQHDAKKRNIKFSLTKERFKILTQKNCFYCDIPPCRIRKPEGNNGSFVYNGIDRINSSFGYIDGNVVACCTTCNFAKQDMDVNIFFDWVNRIYNHSVKNKKEFKNA